MADVFTTLAEQTLGLEPAIRPQTATRFGPEPNVAGEAIPEDLPTQPLAHDLDEGRSVDDSGFSPNGYRADARDNRGVSPSTVGRERELGSEGFLRTYPDFPHPQPLSHVVQEGRPARDSEIFPEGYQANSLDNRDASASITTWEKGLGGEGLPSPLLWDAERPVNVPRVGEGSHRRASISRDADNPPDMPHSVDGLARDDSSSPATWERELGREGISSPPSRDADRPVNVTRVGEGFAPLISPDRTRPAQDDLYNGWPYADSGDPVSPILATRFGPEPSVVTSDEPINSSNESDFDENPPLGDWTETYPAAYLPGRAEPISNVIRPPTPLILPGDPRAAMSLPSFQQMRESVLTPESAATLDAEPNFTHVDRSERFDTAAGEIDEVFNNSIRSDRDSPSIPNRLSHASGKKGSQRIDTTPLPDPSSYANGEPERKKSGDNPISFFNERKGSTRTDEGSFPSADEAKADGKVTGLPLHPRKRGERERGIERLPKPFLPTPFKVRAGFPVNSPQVQSRPKHPDPGITPAASEQSAIENNPESQLAANIEVPLTPRFKAHDDHKNDRPTRPANLPIEQAITPQNKATPEVRAQRRTLPKNPENPLQPGASHLPEAFAHHERIIQAVMRARERIEKIDHAISPADQPSERSSVRSNDSAPDQRKRPPNPIQPDQPIVPTPDRRITASQLVNKADGASGNRSDQRSAEGNTSALPPTIRVTIGRIEVRSPPAASVPRKRSPPPTRSPLSLDDYLKGGKSK